MKFPPALVAATLFFAMPLQAAEGLKVNDPWIQAAPPVSQTQAGYLTIENPGAKEITIVGAESPGFAKIEMHETMMHDGKSMMHPRDRLSVAPGGQLKLAPGGLHLMLIAPQKPLQPKERVPVTLKLGDGGKLTFEAEVRAGGSGGHEQHMHH
ncbi:MAG: copper chaperone PCu(A)C [Magnetococcales bacterium]|nr:copper chaperone PCu(A)C [Magnetococcales bacterium]